MQTFSELFYNLTTLPQHNIYGLYWIDFITCWVLLSGGLFNVIYSTVNRIKNKHKNKVLFTLLLEVIKNKTINL